MIYTVACLLNKHETKIVYTFHVNWSLLRRSLRQALSSYQLMHCSDAPVSALKFNVRCATEKQQQRSRISRSNGKMRCKTPLPHPITEMQASATSVQFVVASSCSFLSYFVYSSFSLFLCLFFHPLSIKQLDF